MLFVYTDTRGRYCLFLRLPSEALRAYIGVARFLVFGFVNFLQAVLVLVTVVVMATRCHLPTVFMSTGRGPTCNNVNLVR